jgi:hypothetical protein
MSLPLPETLDKLNCKPSHKIKVIRVRITTRARKFYESRAIPFD